jgi:hypothetical protein
MTALDTTIVKEGVDQETVEAVSKLSGAYKYGWNTEIEMDYAPKGVNPDIVRLISGKNDEPEWMTDWRLAAFARWEQLGRAHLGDGQLSQDRLSGSVLLRPAEEHGGEAESRSMRSIRSSWRPTRSWVSR